MFRNRCHTCKLRYTRLLLRNSGEVHHTQDSEAGLYLFLFMVCFVMRQCQ